MAAKILNSSFFKKNRKKLLQKLEPNSVAIVINNEFFPKNGDQTFRFRPNSSFFYLTGIDKPNSILLLSNAHPLDEFSEILFIEKRDKIKEIWTGKMLSEQQARKISGVENVKFLDEFDSIVSEILFYADNIYLENYEQPKYWRSFNDATYRFYEKLKFRYPTHNFRRLFPLIVKLRLKKQPEEIRIIKQAINLTKEAFLHILSVLKPNIYEYEIEAELIYYLKRHNADFGYYPIIGCGNNNNILHYIENNCRCKKTDLLLMDFGAQINYYTADITRTVPVSGRFSKKQKLVYQAVLETLNYVKANIKIGITIRQLNKLAEDFITEKLLELQLLKKSDLLKDKQAFKKFYMHGVSHFLGLDVHDVGTKDIPLEAGMILTCEPGIYINNKFGIRLENNILVKSKGIEDLSEEIPIEADQIEALITKNF